MIKKSVFKDGNVVYGVDYSHKRDCLYSENITKEQYQEEISPKDTPKKEE